MKRKGYCRYRGARKTGKIITTIALLIVIFGALAFLLGQNYIVYDDDGSSHLELPFLQKNEEKEKENVVIEYQEPEIDTRNLQPIQAKLLNSYNLSWNSEYNLEYIGDNAMMVEVKDFTGALAYQTDVEVLNTIKMDYGENRAHLEELLGQSDYSIALMCTLCDSYFVRNNYENSITLTTTGGLFYDSINGRSWIDPSSKYGQNYIISMCQEYARLGFEEIVLDYFSYPTSGRLDLIDLPEGLNRVEVIQKLADSIREKLPDGMVLSVVVRSEMNEEFGLTAEMLAETFDRIYIANGFDATEFISQLPTTFDQKSRLVTMTYGTPESESYVLLA